MPYEQPHFIPDFIRDITSTPWGRLLTETPLDNTTKPETYKLGLKTFWPSTNRSSQAQIHQSLLALWPELFDDIGKSDTELDNIGRQNYEAILALTQRDRTVGEHEQLQLRHYATVMAWVIAAQRELLTIVMPNIRKDTKRGYKMIATSAEGGRNSQRQRREKRAEAWKRRDQEIVAMRRKHPDWSQREIARHVARICGEKPETIRKYMVQHKERFGF
jgi:hypothetical protein